MEYTLFPGFCLEKLQEAAGILEGPLEIAATILQNAQFSEIRTSIENDQKTKSLERAQKRGLEFRNGKTKSHMKPELVVAFFIARNFYNDCYGSRGYQLMCENSSLQKFIAKMGLVSFPKKNTIHDQISLLSERSFFLFNKATLNCVQQEGLDDFSALIIDSTAVEADSSWPVDSEILKKLCSKFMKYLEEIHQDLPSLVKRKIPIQRLQNYCRNLAELDFEISYLKGRKGARSMRKKLYVHEVIARSRKFIERFEVILKRIKQLPQSFSTIDAIQETASRFLDKLLMVEHRFGVAPQDYDDKTARKIYSMSDDDASFIKKGGRETIFGYRPSFSCSAMGFISSFTLEAGNTNDSKAFSKCLERNKEATGVYPSMISVDDGYSSIKNLNLAIDQEASLISISGSKGKKILGTELYDSQQYKLARNIRSISEGTISKLKNYHGLKRFRVCGIKRVRQETFIAVIGFNLERLCQLLSQNVLKVAA